MTDAGILLLFLGALALIACVYFIPAAIAFRRRRPSRWVILVVNVVFGGTGIGWLCSLIWALNLVHRPDTPDASCGRESGLNIFLNDVKTVRVLGSPAPGGSPTSAVAVPLLPLGAAIADCERLGDFAPKVT